ncbi:hypothetical protein PMIN06_011086 [Paraphaeosphaeria minitans]
MQDISPAHPTSPSLYPTPAHHGPRPTQTQRSSVLYPEPLEQILLFTYFPPLALLYVRLTNRNANATIISMGAFRRVRLLDATKTPKSTTQQKESKKNPLLEKMFPTSRKLNLSAYGSARKPRLRPRSGI